MILISTIPYSDVVFIEIDNDEKVSDGGIVILDSKEPQSSGKVLAIGDEAEDVLVGDKVFFGKNVGSKLRVDGSDVIVMREQDIQAVL